MKNFRFVLAVMVVLMVALSAAASDNMFMAFDKTSQKMQTVVRSDAPFRVVVQYTQTNPNGFIGDVDQTAVNEYEQWAEAPLSPIDPARQTGMEPGALNIIHATAELFNEFDEHVGTVFASDTLVVDQQTGLYGYVNQVLPVLPDTIRVSMNFCAHIGHGTYVIPIKCDAPDPNGSYPDPDSVEVYVQNGCSDPAHCNENCDSLDNWSLFGHHIRSYPGCFIFLTLNYCGMDDGCICIWRSDERTPVEIAGFTATAGDNRVTLNWNTASESNLQYFRITRAESRDGQYAPVGAPVPAQNNASGARYSWTDESVANGRTYYYKLHVTELNGHTAYYNLDGSPIVAEATPQAGAGIATDYAMGQNYPNPFNSQTTFTFSIPSAERVTLKVYDLVGREVATVMDRQLAANTYTVNWSAEGLATGVYMYKMTAGSFTATKKLLYLK